MSRKNRLTLFFVCFFLFLLLTPLVIIYPQGYRINFNFSEGNKIITQTGGIFIKAVPKQAEIYIDNKLKKKTDFFFGSALIENLVPKEYKIKVQKENYHPWEKNLKIKEKEVTDAKNIILFPKKVDLEILKEAEEFSFSPDEKKLALKTTNDNDWQLIVIDLEKETESSLTANEKFSLPGESFLTEFNFSQDSKLIRFKIEDEESSRIFEAETNRLEDFILSEKIIPSPVESAVAYHNENYYLDKYGELIKYGEKITALSFPIEEEKKYDLNVFKDSIFLNEKDKLYLFNPEKKEFQVFFENFKGLKISPGKEKMIYFSSHEIWLFFLENASHPYNKEKGDRILLARLSENINQIFWLNQNYFIFSTDENIKISETDYRDRLNIINFIDKENLPENKNLSKIFWNSFDKRIYLLSGNSLLRSEKLNQF
jgi:hypothetical protein